MSEDAAPEAEDEGVLLLERPLPFPDFPLSATDMVTISETDNWKPRETDSARLSLTLDKILGSKSTSAKGDDSQKSRFLCLSATDGKRVARYRSFLAETQA